jgi:PAS domain-containing protein
MTGIRSNPEFEKLSGQPASELLEKPWSHLQGKSDPTNEAQHDLGTAIVYSSGHVGTFVVKRPEGDKAVVDVYSNVIEDESGRPAFPLAALVDVGVHDQAHHVSRHARLGPSVLISENWY